MSYTPPRPPAGAGALGDWARWAKGDIREGDRASARRPSLDAAKAWLDKATQALTRAICDALEGQKRETAESIERTKAIRSGIFAADEQSPAARRKQHYIARAEEALAAIVIEPQVLTGPGASGLVEEFDQKLRHVEFDLDRVRYNTGSGPNFSPEGATVIDVKPGQKWEASGGVSREGRDTIDRWRITSAAPGGKLKLEVTKCPWAGMKAYAGQWLQQGAASVETTDGSIEVVFEGAGQYGFKCWLEDPQRTSWEAQKCAE